MWPAMFSAKPDRARMRKAHASACGSVRSTPIGGVMRGAQRASPPSERSPSGAAIGRTLRRPVGPDRGELGPSPSASTVGIVDQPVSRAGEEHGRSAVGVVRRPWSELVARRVAVAGERRPTPPAPRRPAPARPGRARRPSRRGPRSRRDTADRRRGRPAGAPAVRPAARRTGRRTWPGRWRCVRRPSRPMAGASPRRSGSPTTRRPRSAGADHRRTADDQRVGARPSGPPSDPR